MKNLLLLLFLSTTFFTNNSYSQCSPDNEAPVARCKTEGEVIDQQVTDAPGLVTSNYGFAQTFKAGVTGMMTAIDMKVWVEYGPTSAVFPVMIKSGSDPAGGTVLGQTTISVTNNNDTEYHIEFPTPFPVTAGSAYVVVVEDGGINPGAALARIKAEDYADGSYYAEINPGQYLNIASVDLGFTTYVSSTIFSTEIGGNGMATVSGNDIDDQSTDNCGIVSYVANPSSFDCYALGTPTVTLTVTDAAGNTATCSTTINLSDPNSNCCQAPTAVCNDFTVELNGSGSAGILPDDVGGASTANCGTQSETVLPNSFNCSNIGPNTVTYTITDINGATATCTSVVTVEDNIKPSLTCQGNTVVDADQGACEATVTLNIPANSDNCAVTTLRYRHRQVDDQGNEIMGMDWSSWSPSSSPTTVLPIGFNQIQWQAKDASNNQKKCSFIIEVEDGEAPTPVCLNPIIGFNGENDILLDETKVWDDVSSTDNCGSVLFFSVTPDNITCDQVGSVIPVTVTVEDSNGNTAECTSSVTVGGLPCGWSANPNGVNCPGGSQGSYDPNANSFSVSSDGCYNPNYYSSSDSYGYVGTEICGDGEIIAQITQVSGNGFAGIIMREDLTAGSKMIRVGIDGINLTKRGLRNSTGGLAFNHQFQTQGKNWLRLSRSGNVFSAYHSTDGINWGAIIMTPIPMGNCLELGFYAESNAANGTVVGTFENVSINSAAPLISPDQPNFEVNNDLDVERNIRVFPNPAGNEAWIDLGQIDDQKVSTQIFNNLGKLIHQIPASQRVEGTIQLNLEDWEAGLYLIKIQIGEEQVITKRLLHQN